MIAGRPSAPLTIALGDSASKKISFTLPAIRALAGTVQSYDASQGEYVAVTNAVVRLEELNRQAISDGSGRYLFRSLPAGLFTIAVKRPAIRPTGRERESPTQTKRHLPQRNEDSGLEQRAYRDRPPGRTWTLEKVRINIKALPSAHTDSLISSFEQLSFEKLTRR